MYLELNTIIVTLSSGDRLYDPAPRTTYYTGFKYKF